MIIAAPNLNLFFTDLDTRYGLAFDLAPVWNPQIATLYTAKSSAWQMAWIGALDKLRPWSQGARVVHTPAPQTYGVTIQRFELTEGIDVDVIDDDTHSVYGLTAAHMGTESAKWPDYNVRDLIEGLGIYSSTAAQLGTDGVANWSTVHPVNVYDPAQGTYPNDYGTGGLSINGITVGGAFSTNAWATVWQDAASRKNESGEKIGQVPDLTMVPVQLKFAAATITQSQMFAPPTLVQLGTGNFPTAGSPSPANAPFVGQMDNPLRGSTDLFVNFDLTSAAAWYMLTTKRVIKPFGWILRMAPQLIPRMTPQDPSVFNNNIMLYGVKARGAAAWSLPWLGSRSGI